MVFADRSNLAAEADEGASAAMATDAQLAHDLARAAGALLQDIKRIFVGPVIDAEHDHRTDAGPQHARIHPAFRLRGEPVHLAMGAGIEKGAEMLRGLRNRIGTGHRDAVETKRKRFADEGLFE